MVSRRSRARVFDGSLHDQSRQPDIVVHAHRPARHRVVAHHGGAVRRGHDPREPVWSGAPGGAISTSSGIATVSAMSFAWRPGRRITRDRRHDRRQRGNSRQPGALSGVAHRRARVQRVQEQRLCRAADSVRRSDRRHAGRSRRTLPSGGSRRPRLRESSRSTAACRALQSENAEALSAQAVARGDRLAVFLRGRRTAREYVAGGASMLFGDLLGDHQLLTAVYVSSQLDESALGALSVNRKARLNWGAKLRSDTGPAAPPY